MSMSHVQSNRSRRGVILVIVVACLALFLSIGIAFVFYANQQAVSMRYQREASNGGRTANVNQSSRGYMDEAPPSAVDLFNLAMSQVIYDVPDDQTGYYSALRGHSLARSMYGYNSTQPLSNTTPYNGMGRLHYSYPSGSAPPDPNLPPDTYNSINYVPFPYLPSGKTTPVAGTIRNPEWESGVYISKNAPYTYPDENNLFLAAIRPSDGKVLVPSYFRPWLVNPNNSTGWLPSSFGAGAKFKMLRPDTGTNNTSNAAFPAPNKNADGSWGDVENLPGKAGGPQYDSMWTDLDAPVRMWRGQLYKPLFAFLIVDLDGRINLNVAGNEKGMPTPGKHNAGAAAGLPTSASLQGWGPWEMNPSFVLNPTYASGTPDPQQVELLAGTPLSATAPPTTVGRYGVQRKPTGIYVLDDSIQNPEINAPAGSAAPFYSQADFDGSAFTNTTNSWYPKPNSAPNQLQFPLAQYYTSPKFLPRYASGTGTERTYHPLLYNPYFTIQTPKPAPTHSKQAPIYNFSYAPSEMFYLNNMENADAANYGLSYLANLLPTSLGNSTLLPSTGPNYRFLTTVFSNDLQVPGMRPWLWQGTPPTAASYTLTGQQPMGGGPINSPNPGTASPQSNTAPSDFDANWRSIFASTLGSIDLNRKLTDYRGYTNQPFEQVVEYNGKQVFNGEINFVQAQADRQQLAKDIFYRLCAATGVNATYGNGAPFKMNAGATPPQVDAARRLAQIAVNIVDYTDNDDYITPFNWYPAGAGDTVYQAMMTSGAPTATAPAPTPDWVFGTELPRLVINEAYANYDNDYSGTMRGGSGADPHTSPPPMKIQYGANPYHLGLWVELHNPLTPPPAAAKGKNGTHADPTLSYGGGAPLVVTNPQTKKVSDVYRLVVTTNTNANLRNASNVAGYPDTPTVATTAVKAGNGKALPTVNGYIAPLGSASVLNGVVMPSNATAGSPPTVGTTAGSNPGFYLIGPKNVQNYTAMGAAPATLPGPQNIPVNYDSEHMMWTVPNSTTNSAVGPSTNAVGGAGGTAITSLNVLPNTIFLQRLLCPHLPYNNTPGGKGYNPYITVDYVTLPPNQIYDHRKWTSLAEGGGTSGTNKHQTLFGYQVSYGRAQPYAAATSPYGTKGSWVLTNTGGTPAVAQQTGPGVFPAATNGTGFWVPQMPTKLPSNSDTVQFSNTFYEQNTVSGKPLSSFDWLVHLDRALISPPEIFCVSAWHPHELTQQFVTAAWPAPTGLPNPAPQQHMANWNGTMVGGKQPTLPTTTAAVAPAPTNPNDVRLYRALGLLDVRNRTLGMGFGGRVPGKVNINTIWDPATGAGATNTGDAGAPPAAGAPAATAPPTFSAICAVDPGNFFSQTMVNNAWNAVVNLRSPTILGSTPTALTANPTLPAWAATSMKDLPFMPPSEGYTSQDKVLGYGGTAATTNAVLGSEGIQRTILGFPQFSNTTVTAPATYVHPYIQNEMLTKIFNNITTRSNTFSVYCTIGYFQVTNQGPYSATNRPILGPELGVNDGTNIRHKFFALVDRTNLTVETETLPKLTTAAMVTNGTASVRQGQRPVFLSYEPLNATSPAVAPEQLQAPANYTVMNSQLPDPEPIEYEKKGAGAAMRHPIVAVRVPATGYTKINGQVAATGIYDGIAWTMAVGDTILIAPGPNEVLAKVHSVGGGAFEGPNHGAKVTLQLEPNLKKPAKGGRLAAAQSFVMPPRGSVMQLNYEYKVNGITYTNVLGNPGPQPGFNYKDARYNGVVPLVVQLN
jgi:hypothetical protein